MFGDITRVGANFNAMQSLSNLKRVNGEIGQVQSRLSSGKRINSAEDDTSGYALSKHLESRGRGLSQALDNVGTAKNVLNIAEGGYQSQMDILQQIKESLTQAADGALSTEQRGAIGDRIDSLLTEFDDIRDQTKYNGYVLFSDDTTDATSGSDRTMTFQVGEENTDTFAVEFDNSNRINVGESGTSIDGVLATDTDSDGTTDTWSQLSQTDATSGIAVLDTAIKEMAKSIQKMGDYQARLSSKEESLSLGISNTEATRSRIEDADFAKEQMTMMKLQILQQTSVSAFTQSNSAPQVVLSLFR
jgi:flagellin